MILAATGAVLALLDRRDQHHKILRAVFEERPERWILPAVVLPEVDYLAGTRLGARVQDAFLNDLAEGLYQVEFGDQDDVAEAWRIHKRHRTLRLGFVDACVIAIAERLRVEAIATLDVRHFGAVAIVGKPKLFPRDLRRG